MSCTDAPTLKKRKQISRRCDAPFFKARTSPRSIYKLIQVFSDEQKQAVRDIGLSSILDLAISHCPVHISRYLLLNFDVQNRCIILENGDKIILEEEDVQTVLNIPRGPVEILESLGNDRGDSSYNEFLKAWRARWGIKSNIGGPSTGEIYKRLSESQAGDENFKVDFTVLFVSLFLWGTKNQTCRYKILKSLMDVENIKNLNWCAFTLKALASSVEHWKSNQKSHFDGPMTFLLLTYLDRCEYKARKLSERRFPVISCWDDKKVDERVRWEELGGGYGMGRAVPRANNDQVEQPRSHPPPRQHLVPLRSFGIDTDRSQSDNHLQILSDRMRASLNDLGATLLEVSSVMDEMQATAISLSNHYVLRIGSYLEELKSIQSRIIPSTYDRVMTANATSSLKNPSPTSIHEEDVNCREGARSISPSRAFAIPVALNEVRRKRKLKEESNFCI